MEEVNGYLVYKLRCKYCGKLEELFCRPDEMVDGKPTVSGLQAADFDFHLQTHGVVKLVGYVSVHDAIGSVFGDENKSILASEKSQYFNVELIECETLSHYEFVD